MEHIISKGETLITIAKKFNSSLKDLMILNDIVNPNNLNLGDVISIPVNNINTKYNISSLDSNNFTEKFNLFLNFIEGKKIKKPLSSLAISSIKNVFLRSIELDINDLRMISYILATIHWETGALGQKFIFEPKSEFNKGKGKPYGVPHKKTGKVYYSRGFIDFLWFDNYERFTKIFYKLGYDIDLINNPDELLKPEVATLLLIIGMRDGKFTGKALEDYFDPIKSDWYNARQIIKEKDKAVIISEIAKEFYYILK